jgi:hypothetical protein
MIGVPVSFYHVAVGRLVKSNPDFSRLPLVSNSPNFPRPLFVEPAA